VQRDMHNRGHFTVLFASSSPILCCNKETVDSRVLLGLLEQGGNQCILVFGAHLDNAGYADQICTISIDVPGGCVYDAMIVLGGGSPTINCCPSVTLLLLLHSFCFKLAVSGRATRVFRVLVSRGSLPPFL